MKLAHIVNVLQLEDHHRSSNLHVAQSTTLESMIAAKTTDDSLDVELHTVSFPDDQVTVPSGFICSSNLKTKCYDVHDMLPTNRKLPLIREILQSAPIGGDVDYIIYTNIDIGLFSTFYKFVLQQIDNGFDGFCVNRRDFEKEYDGITVDETNYNQLLESKPGMKHGGYDCFVFHRSLLNKVSRLGDIYIGAPPVGIVLKTWIDHYSSRVFVYKNVRQTFHLGRDQAWKSQPNNIFWQRNNMHGKNVIKQIKNDKS